MISARAIRPGGWRGSSPPCPRRRARPRSRGASARRPRRARRAAGRPPRRPRAPARRPWPRGERERGRELAVDHHRALELGVGRADGRAVDRLEEGPRVDAEALGQRDRLRQRLGEAEQPGVEHELEALGRARLAQPHGLRADRVEDRVDALAHVLGPGGEHDQLALLGRLPGPRDRRVDERDAGVRARARQAVGGGEPDRAHLGEHRAVQRAERLLGHRLDGARVGQHRHHHVGARDRLGHAAGDGDAVLRERLGLLARAVPGAHLVAGGGEVARHRRAHDPGAQDGDAHQ